MTLEEFEKEITKGIFYNIDEIAQMAKDVEESPELRNFARIYFKNIAYTEGRFKKRLKSMGIEVKLNG